MDIMDVIKARHSVRQYDDRALTQEDAEALGNEVAQINADSGFNFQLVVDEPEAFQANKPSYGLFKGCRNYLVVVGPKGRDVEAGYWGEHLVLFAQAMGINSCWVALTYKKGRARIQKREGDKLYLVIALGYGITQGQKRKSKTLEQVSDYKEGDPAWYKLGLEAALLAPTATNQQKFKFSRNGEEVSARVSGLGPCTKLDLGIVTYHFEAVTDRPVLT